MKARRRMLRNILPAGPSSSTDAANAAVADVEPAAPGAAADPAVSTPSAANPIVASAPADDQAAASGSAAELAAPAAEDAAPASSPAAEPAAELAVASASAAEPAVARPRRPTVAPEVTRFWGKAWEALRRRNELRARLGRPPLDHQQREEFLRTRVALATEIKELEFIRRGGSLWS